MTKIAFFECPTGIAGDMCLGALIHAGLPVKYLIDMLNQLGIANEYQLRSEQVLRNGQLATKVHIDLLEHDHDHDHDHHHHHTRHLPEIKEMIINAKLPSQVERWSLAIFENLAIAEGHVHGIPPEQVHFHEVGATDAIIDIVGTCVGLHWLEIDEIYCSKLPTGGGIINAAHGQLSVPVPAVLKLWELHQVPVYHNGINKELVTPTGAAITCTLAKSFGNPPDMTVQTIGLGAGERNLPIPNILRLWLGESSEFLAGQEEEIYVLSTQIDDLNPQIIGYIFERLFAVGALDVFTQSIGMKKSRPGILLTVICHPENRLNCEEVIFRETSTLGIRRSKQKRAILAREIAEVNTDYGVIRVKIARDGENNIINVHPEYEDCAEIARKNKIPLREIYQLVMNKK